ncbi:MAG: TonB family protein [Bacteroidales bacterium]
MDPKKTRTANLERKKGLHFVAGLLVSLAVILISFEWTTPAVQEIRLAAVPAHTIDMVDVIVLPREQPKPKLPAIQPILVPVDFEPDEELIPFFDVEVTHHTLPDYTFSISDELPAEIVVEDFPIVQVMPTFNGGDPRVEFFRYIQEHMIYPREAIENHIHGRVILQFVVNQHGRVERAVVLKGVHPVLDEEALRVVNSSPEWVPGFQNGKHVNVIYSFPVIFQLR